MSAKIAVPPERQGRPAPEDLAEQRAQVALAVESGVFGTARPSAETRLGNRRTLRFDPAGEPRGHLLHLHGGGYRLGQPEYVAAYAETVARRTGLAVHLPEYRLAPEHPFPAGLIDALAALEGLAAEIGEAPIFVGGDSAGGGLAAGLGVLSQAGLAPKIDGAILHSPWLDLTVTAPAYRENAASDPLFSVQSAHVAADHYLQGGDARHPLASPLHAPLASYPPTFISVGTGEVLADDSLRFHELLEQCGARSQLVAIDGMEHVAVTRDLALSGAADTLEAMIAFIEKRLGD